MTNNQNRSSSTISIVSLVLGLAALLLLVAGVFLGFLVEAIGITSLISPTIVLGVLAVVCAIMYKNQDSDSDKSPSAIRMANAGLITGVIALLLAVLLRVAVFIFFIPWLAAGL